MSDDVALVLERLAALEMTVAMLMRERAEAAVRQADDEAAWDRAMG